MTYIYELTSSINACRLSKFAGPLESSKNRSAPTAHMLLRRVEEICPETFKCDMMAHTAQKHALAEICK